MLTLAPDGFAGRQLGKYEVLCRLSTGGMAEIFLASQRGLAGFRKLVVLKKILPDIRGEEEFVRMFLDEAKVTAAFNHPNIAQVYDLDIAEGELFLAMEFVPGATLVEVARACRTASLAIPIGYTLASVRDTAVALHYAHTFTDPLGRPSPVIHRDIAEKNIMVTYEGVTKLLDFGIAKSLARASRTQVGMVKGTSGYMSPEQILGEPLDARSDLFSLGVVLHECLTGMRLFYGRTPEAGMQAVLSGDVPPPSRANKEVPPELDAIVLKALARQREERYASTLEFARALDRALGGVIWHPEQSAELMQRLFADRREQTRQLLASGQLGSPDHTGEIRLAQLFGNGSPFAVPPPAPAAPATPPPVLAQPPLPGATPTGEAPVAAPPVAQGLPPTTPARGAQAPRRTPTAVAPSPATPASPRRVSNPALQQQPPPAPEEPAGPVSAPPTPRRTRTSLQAHTPPPPEPAGLNAPPTAVRPQFSLPPVAPPAPEDATGPITLPPPRRAPASEETTAPTGTPAVARRPAAPEEVAGPTGAPPTPRRTQASLQAQAPSESTGRRPAPEKRPDAARPPPPPDEVSRAPRTEGTAHAEPPRPRESTQGRAPMARRPPVDPDGEATVPQGKAARGPIRRPASAPVTPYRAADDDDEDARTVVTADEDDDSVPESTMPGVVLPHDEPKTQLAAPAFKDVKPSKPASSRKPLIIGALVLGVVLVALVLLRLDGGLISSELPTLSELFAPSGVDPGDLRPLPVPADDGSGQPAQPASGTAPAPASGTAPAKAPAPQAAQPTPAAAPAPAPAAQPAQATAPNTAPAAPAPTTDDTLVPLGPPSTEPSKPAKAEAPAAASDDSRGTKRKPLPPKRGKRPADEADTESSDDTAQASAPASKETGQLTLIIEPFAKVYLGGKLLGETPLFKLSLPAGKHSLRVVGPDDKPRRLAVEVKPGETTSLRMPLELLARE